MEGPLEFKTRRRIFVVISENPGINESDIVRISGLNRGTVRYQLDYLEKRELISSSHEGKFKHYFPKNRLPSAQRDILKCLTRSIPRSLVVYVLLYPGANFGQIAEEFDLVPSTISYHLSKLVEAGILIKDRKGKETYFRLQDPETVADVLVAFRESYLANVSDRFALMLEARRRKEKGT